MNTKLVSYWQDFFVRCQKYTSANMPEVMPNTSLNLHPAAADLQIEALERKFNVALPESYQTFLAVTNGISFFRNIEFLSLNNLDDFYLLKDYYPFLIEEWEEIWEEQGKWHCPDELYNYFLDKDYEAVDMKGEKQIYPPEGFNMTKDMIEHRLLESYSLYDKYDSPILPIRVNYLKDLIIIGIQQDEGECYCINPNVKTSTNEYEIWEIMPKLFDYPFNRYLNFVELMEYLLGQHIENCENSAKWLESQK